ncbi:LysR family transcriptional regulator [Paenibacillus thalictri]|uniref:LysR family transcriptional regulator n=1 Tax=Paenibacillus thalictri TaxID=2527873 RepID=A0A4Q9DI33_9BACL|nr:LysR family transcriptional regulator [Paenibacillus thalictri]TBL72718.1 LysR family transcriptional regulator [Paenibacillus thalictri]
MDWQQLEYFRVLAKMEHMTKAAKYLAISQPALSRSIHRLEAELGISLFDRVGRAIRVNESGRLFLHRVERAQQEIDTGIGELRQLNSPLTGTVSLAFLLTFGMNILPDIIGQFNKMYPNVEFVLHQNTTMPILERLLERQSDLCLVGPVNGHKGITWRKLMEEELFIYVAAEHRLAGRSELRLEELADEPFIGFKKGYVMRGLSDEYCRQAGFVPRIRFEGDDVGTLAGLVSSGLGAAMIPAFSGVDASKIKQIRISEPLCKREIGLAWLEGRTFPPSVELFHRFIMNWFA